MSVLPADVDETVTSRPPRIPPPPVPLPTSAPPSPKVLPLPDGAVVAAVGDMEPAPPSLPSLPPCPKRKKRKRNEEEEEEEESFWGQEPSEQPAEKQTEMKPSIKTSKKLVSPAKEAQSSKTSTALLPVVNEVKPSLKTTIRPEIVAQSGVKAKLERIYEAKLSLQTSTALLPVVNEVEPSLKTTIRPEIVAQSSVKAKLERIYALANAQKRHKRSKTPRNKKQTKKPWKEGIGGGEGGGDL
ncbi:hypothetical protein HRR83_003652 [Exophiala dermatitidis]|uniref:Uncharacterized protein n=1 Tax=Exophiala dermatitidis TaxID=5970 RepID=A0AAN6EYB3_EXODE|nr:hypothetical protein HRR75_002717 [Exophiala dermatitidis]KAJ4522383.1 hypothetical protein HRR74_002968 [Exophiala dermatitidis]KAJ4529708.1 hypothetical protein HRR73_000736 [Exophiala dermatitidis]KAJ4543626.1 hypothetical protein HRR76_001693 [Exophiala dermatitidis]KAJ4557313.1 hypothetical protein HRR78_000980 [Exophiala dermatitidis]